MAEVGPRCAGSDRGSASAAEPRCRNRRDALDGDRDRLVRPWAADMAGDDDELGEIERDTVETDRLADFAISPRIAP